jgi:hypothetical protein
MLRSGEAATPEHEQAAKRAAQLTAVEVSSFTPRSR